MIAFIHLNWNALGLKFDLPLVIRTVPLNFSSGTRNSFPRKKNLFSNLSAPIRFEKFLIWDILLLIFEVMILSFLFVHYFYLWLKVFYA